MAERFRQNVKLEHMERGKYGKSGFLTNCKIAATAAGPAAPSTASRRASLELAGRFLHPLALPYRVLDGLFGKEQAQGLAIGREPHSLRLRVTANFHSHHPAILSDGILVVNDVAVAAIDRHQRGSQVLYWSSGIHFVTVSGKQQDRQPRRLVEEKLLVIDLDGGRPDQLSLEVDGMDAGPLDGVAEHSLRRLHLHLIAIASQCAVVGQHNILVAHPRDDEVRRRERRPELQLHIGNRAAVAQGNQDEMPARFQDAHRLAADHRDAGPGGERPRRPNRLLLPGIEQGQHATETRTHTWPGSIDFGAGCPRSTRRPAAVCLPGEDAMPQKINSRIGQRKTVP